METCNKVTSCLLKKAWVMLETLLPHLMNPFVIADIAPDYSDYLFPQILQWHPVVRGLAALFLFLLATILIEGAIFYAFGFRTKKELVRVAVLNVISMVLPVLLLAAFTYEKLPSEFYFNDEDLMLLNLGVLVLLVEMIFTLVFFKHTKKWKLFLLVLLANAVSFFPSLWVMGRFF